MKYWNIKTFDTYEELEDWISKNRKKCQYEQIFIDNTIAVQYRDLQVIV